MVAAIGTGDAFSKGRDFAASAGPRAQADLDWRPHHPRQDIEARQPLRARSIRASSVGRADQATELGASRAQALDRGRAEGRTDVLAIALANKLARIAWSVLARARSFEARPSMASAA